MTNGLATARLRFAADDATDGRRPDGADAIADLDARRAALGLDRAADLASLVAGALAIVVLHEAPRIDEAVAVWLWVGAAFVVGLAGFATHATWRRMVRDGRDAAGWERALVAVVLGVLVLLVPYPWLPVGDAPATRIALAAGAILAASTACGALARASQVSAAVPLAWTLVALVHEPAARRTTTLLAALAVAALARGVARAGGGRADAAAAEAFRVASRIDALAAARDAAIRSDRDKSRFLAIASHDLRQPLHALGLFAATLEKRSHGTADAPVIHDMVQAIDGLGLSFNALMDVSQLDAGTIRPRFARFPLRDVFRRLHMHFAGQAELAGLALRLSAGGKSVTSDPQLFERILGNLVQNALRYTVRGGVVVVARTTATHFHVEVWDTGLGMSDAELPRVFDEFYQVERADGVRARGLGMGLAIVKRLVLLLGHELVVVSRVGRGSMFRIAIPHGSLSGIEDATLAADTLPMPLVGHRTALVVDDDATIRAGLDLLLAEWGYRAVGASNLDEACYAVRVTESTPDLVLCDLHLGDGPDGFAVVEAVRRQCGRDLPAILVTGDAPGAAARAAGAGLLVLSKPVQPRVLRNALRSLEESAGRM